MCGKTPPLQYRCPLPVWFSEFAVNQKVPHPLKVCLQTIPVIAPRGQPANLLLWYKKSLLGPPFSLPVSAGGPTFAHSYICRRLFPRQVGQEPVLFACSIKDNIVFGVQAYTDGVGPQSVLRRGALRPAREVFAGAMPPPRPTISSNLCTLECDKCGAHRCVISPAHHTGSNGTDHRRSKASECARLYSVIPGWL